MVGATGTAVMVEAMVTGVAITDTVDLVFTEAMALALGTILPGSISASAEDTAVDTGLSGEDGADVATTIIIITKLG